MPAMKPHVLMVGPALDVRGGVSTVARELLGNGLGDYAEVSYVASMVDGSKPRKALQAAIALARFRRMLRAADLVHIHISKGASFYRKKMFADAAQAKGVPFLLHEHDGEFKLGFEGGDEGYRAQVRDLFGRAARVVVLSEEWRDYFAANVCEPEKIVVLHNAVSVPAEPCTPCARQDVLFLGRLDGRKSPDVLLRASRTVLERYPETKVVYGGDGKIDKYRQMAEELGIAGSCEFVGWVTGGDRERLFERAAVYCLPSKNEGLPMSVLEAMAHALPVVTTPVGGIPQVVHDGVEGFLMPVDDEEVLAKRLLDLLGDPDLRGKMGFAARREIVSDFGITAAVEKTKDIYGDCLGV